MSIDGTSGNDSLDGTAGDDTINGLAGNDTLYGLDGADVINGGDGTNYIQGGSGADALYGDAGNDTLLDTAGFGGVLDGGAGYDSAIVGGVVFIDGQTDDDPNSTFRVAATFGGAALYLTNIELVNFIGEFEEIVLGGLGDDFLSSASTAFWNAVRRSWK
ncbi:MAG: hypothetical protein R3C58_11570 [Parvularculaceae bacterium]